MCCLFGTFNYSGKPIKKMNDLINSLACEATERGTDATGISYNKDNKLVIYKKPKSAYCLDFKDLEEAVCVTGHTRHSTQGDKNLNYNNHPFMGYCENTKFALSHNGVLFNDKILHNKLNLPDTKIKTDSYIATQLLEYYNNLNVANIKKMSEQLEGSFCFSIMDTKNTLYLVKGDNPLYIIKLPKYNLYVYASTPQILFRAIVNTDFFEEIKKGNFEEIKLDEEQILTIFPNGDLHYDNFVQKGYGYTTRSANWWSYNNTSGMWENYYESYEETDEKKSNNKIINTTEYEQEYIKELKETAKYFGYEPDDVDFFRNQGMTLDEIEDLFYQ